MENKWFNKIEMTKLGSLSDVFTEALKGKYIVFADNAEMMDGVDILTQDIMYFDKKNKRIRMMLGHHWEFDRLVIYPVTGIYVGNIAKEFKNICAMGGLKFENYDCVFSVDRKFISVIGDAHKNGILKM